MKCKTSPIMVEMSQTRLGMREGDVSGSKSDCIVVASSRQLWMAKSKISCPSSH
jgi:hypothetical protein